MGSGVFGTDSRHNSCHPRGDLIGDLYPVSFKMHVSECLSDFNSKHCDEIMVVQENVPLHSLISYICIAAL